MDRSCDCEAAGAEDLSSEQAKRLQVPGRRGASKDVLWCILSRTEQVSCKLHRWTCNRTVWLGAVLTVVFYCTCKPRKRKAVPARVRVLSLPGLYCTDSVWLKEVTKEHRTCEFQPTRKGVGSQIHFQQRLGPDETFLESFSWSFSPKADMYIFKQRRQTFIVYIYRVG